MLLHVETKFKVLNLASDLKAFFSILAQTLPQLAFSDPYDPTPNMTGQCFGNCAKLGLKPLMVLDVSKTNPGDEVRQSPFFIFNSIKNGVVTTVVVQLVEWSLPTQEFHGLSLIYY